MEPSLRRDTSRQTTSPPAQKTCLVSGDKLHSWLLMMSKEDDLREASEVGAPQGRGEMKRSIRNTIARRISDGGRVVQGGKKRKVDGGEGCLTVLRYRVTDERAW